VSAVPTCPDAALLERFLLGLVCGTEADHLEEHVAHCARCAETVRTLRAEDGLVQAVRAAGAADDTPHQHLLGAMIPLLKCLRPQDATTLPTLPPSEPGQTTAAGVSLPSFGFLAPSDQAGELGRLGTYHILALLGSGGMGMVFRAYDPRLKRQIALKVIKPELVTRPGILERFLAEAQAVAAVEHDNIVAVYQAAEENGVPFLAMPLLRGESLEARLTRAKGPLPIDEVLHIGRETAAGLAAAHERGLIHRDVKPANIWLEDVGHVSNVPPPGTLETCPTSRIKILDFGLARALRGEETGASQAGTITGTPAYMAPEQAQERPLDGRADLFSLGCVLYRAATGKPPFTGSDVIAVLLNVVSEQPPPPRSLNPEVPADLDDLILRLLAKRPEDRPESARKVAGLIGAIERRRAEEARPWWSRRGWLAATAATLLVGTGLITWLLLTRHEPSPEDPVDVTIEYDENDPRLVLVHGESEQTIDVRKTPKVSLEPGDYLVRQAAASKVLRVVPDRFVVKAGAAQNVKLCLVGELGNYTMHSQAIMGVALVARKEGPLVVSASTDRDLGLWEPLSGKMPAYLKHGNPVYCLAVSADGKRAASGGGARGGPIDLTVHLWDLERRAADGAPLAGHQNRVQSLAFDPDGKRLLSGDAEGAVRLWDLETRKARTLEGHDGLGANGVAFSPDGTQAATAGGDGQLILWDVAGAKEIGHAQASAKPLRAVLLLPGQPPAVTAGDDGLIRLWDVTTRKETASLPGHKGAVLALACSADGKRLLSGGADGTVRLWDPVGKKELYVLEGHRGRVAGVALSADGRKAASGGADDRTLRFWQLPP
jgi:serine/threonine protein kinase